MADKKPNPGKEEWKKKYGSYTWYYANNLDKKDIITGKTIRQIINEKAKKFGIDPAFLTSSLMSEGLDGYNAFDEKDNPFTAQQYIDNALGYPVSGVRHLGMDTVGNRKEELFQRGLLKKDEYKKNVVEIVTKNEDKSLDSVTSGDFKSLDYGIETVAAFHKMENDKFDAYTKKNGIDLTPLQKTFFRYVAYNSGLGNAQEMSKSYNEKGILKDHSFIYEQPYDSWTESWVNANKRITGAMGLNGEEDFERAEGQEDWYAGTNNKQVAVQLEAQGLMGVDAVKAVDKHREAILAANKLDPEGLVPREAEKLTAAGIERAPNVKQKPVEFTPTGLVSTKATPTVATNTNIPLKEVARTKTKSASTIKSTGMAKKTAPTEKELALREQFVTNMQTALGQHESNNNYNAQNPTSTAAGKYQFTERWLKDAGDKSIQAFAKRNGMSVPESLEEFKSNPILQDAFFKYYAKEVLYPNAKEAVSSLNPKGITMEQAGALVHFRGESKAIKEISTGNFSGATKAGVNGAKNDNPSSVSFMNSIATKVGQPITPEQLTAVEIDALPQEEKDKIAKDYTTAVDRITHFEDLDDVDKNRQIAKINAEYKAKGYIPVINEHFTKQNEKNAKASKEKDDKIRESAATFQKWGEKTRLNTGKGVKQASISLGGPEEAKEFKAWAKKNGVKVSGGTNFIFDIDAQNFKVAGVKALTGKDSITQKQIDKISAEAGGEDGVLLDNNLGNKSTENTLRKIASWFTGETVQQSGSLMLDGDALDYANNLNSHTEINLLDPELIPDIPKEEKAPLTDEPVKADATATGDDTKATGLAGDGTPEGESLLDQWGKNLKEDISRKDAEGDGNTYDKDNFKNEIPYDAITGMALGITGLDQARNTKIPKRTEEVSEAYRNFASELAKKSKQGLPPAVEAAMKAQLAEGLQGGLANVVNASGGNRALVLGNLGGLEKARSEGIVEMQLADYEAKERAFAQYGEAVKYQNDFKARKDVANHSIDYQEALKRRSDGEDLANAGFAQMIDGLKYQKENGPGSINHQKKAWLEQEMWGFALDAKPDAPNSYEAFQKKKSAFKEYTGKQLEASEKLASLNPQQKEAYNKFLETNPSEKDGVAMVNYLHGNPGKTKMDTTKFAEAKERQDFGLMFQDAEKPVTEISKPEKIESPAITQIQDMRPTGIPGRATAKKALSFEPNGPKGLSNIGTDPFTPKSPELSEASMTNLEDPDDFEFALGQATENQLSYYNNQ